MTRRFRASAAVVAVLALLFAQLATAAYACPQLSNSEAVAQMQDCDHGAASDPSLCERHCNDGKASVETPKTFSAPDMAATFVRPLLTVVIETIPRAARCAPIATGPPPTRFTVLRI